MLNNAVRGYLTATLESAAGSGRLAELSSDLVVFADALADSEPLRDALSDPTIPPVVRRSIVVDLLEGRAAQEAVDLLGFLVGVVRAPEVALTVSELSQAVAAGDAAGGLDGAAASWSGTRHRIHGYVERCLQELGSLAELDVVEDELFSFARLLEKNPPLRRLLEDPNTPAHARTGVVSDLLTGRVSPTTARIAAYVVSAGRLRNTVGTFDWVVTVAAEERGRRVAHVRSALPLEAAERDRLAASLSRLVGREVEVRVVLDPSVVGGMSVSVGDVLIDGTLRLRLDRLREALAHQL